jgi:hypothetical protein
LGVTPNTPVGPRRFLYCFGWWLQSWHADRSTFLHSRRWRWQDGTLDPDRHAGSSSLPSQARAASKQARAADRQAEAAERQIRAAKELEDNRTKPLIQVTDAGFTETPNAIKVNIQQGRGNGIAHRVRKAQAWHCSP